MSNMFVKPKFSVHFASTSQTSALFALPTRTSFTLAPSLAQRNEDHENENQWRAAYIGFAFGAAFVAYLLIDENEAEEPKPLIWKIVLTGGPCGGKSTAMSSISQRLKSLGFEVYQVPEVATILINGGLSFLGLDNEQFMSVESKLLRLQEFLEDTFYKLAEIRKKPTVILCDRGLCDNRAYVSKETFDVLLDEENLKITDIRDKRYDAVFHLVTAAIGAEKFYTLANNTARSESPEEARRLDYKVLDAWVGHPKLKIIDNSSDFKTKINRVVDGICRIVGAPSVLGFERKFKVNSFSLPSDVTTESFDVETDVIRLDNGNQARLMKRTQKGSSTYVYTTETNSTGNDLAVIERQISGREYMDLKKQSKVGHSTVTKRITHFVWDGLYYSVNEYLGPEKCKGTTILEVETLSQEHKINTPPFISLAEEITDDQRYSTYSFSLPK